MAYLITDQDRRSFKRCRRQWDFGAGVRQNYEPRPPFRNFDLDRALHEALAVYYFPGMWDWDRNIVLPLALEGFHRSVREQRAVVTANKPLTIEEEDHWNESIEIGERVLRPYFTWAPDVDLFAPVRVETDFEVNVPDPERLGHDLVTGGGDPVRYQGRIDALVLDERDAFWVVEHCLGDRFRELHELELEERATAQCWAMEQFFLIPIAGTIYNEVRVHGSEEFLLIERGYPRVRRGPAVSQHRSYPRHDLSVRLAPDERLKQQGDQTFRRTWLARSEREIQNLRLQFADESKEMIAGDLSIYPTPSAENCGHCHYRAPCLAIGQGDDVHSILVQSFAKRVPDSPVRARLGGSSWGIGRGSAPPLAGPLGQAPIQLTTRD